MVNHTRLAGLPRYPDHEGGRLPGRRHHRLERPVRAGGDAQSRCWTTLYAIVAKAIASAEVQEKFKKQNYNIVPSKSLADAQSWLAGEMKHWETVTSAVKIDVGQ